MCSTQVPAVETMFDMTPQQVEALALEMDIQRRTTEASIALYTLRVDRAGAFIPDGHRSVRSWGKAACNWSGQEAARFTRLGRAFELLPIFAAAALAGEIGVAQMHALAVVVANPRVREHLAGSEQLLVDHARLLDHDEFITVLRRWEQLADPDGTDRAHERAHRDRRAAIHLLGEKAYLDAVGGSAQGVIMLEILEQFTESEWQQEWLDGLARYGDTMHPGLLERTPAQRRFDALFALFRAAAGSDTMGGDVLVNVVVDQATLEREMARAAGADPEPIDPSTVADRHCETDRGVVLHPADVLAMAWIGQLRRVVFGGDGVVLDFGRRKRLFTGAQREAVLLSGHRCIWPGCDLPASKCQADHTHPHGRGGPTATRNGGPLCSRHNPWKNRGFTTIRGPMGTWTVRRHDGSTLGWRARTNTNTAAGRRPPPPTTQSCGEM